MVDLQQWSEVRLLKAFSSEVDAGSRDGNASKRDPEPPFGYSSGTETAAMRSAPGVGFAVERLMTAYTLSPKNRRKRTNDAWCFAGSTCNRLNQNVFVVTILTFPRCPQHGTTRNDLISRCLIGV
ncbi:MAG: hypothetical protein WBA62_03950 [Xanthobacteraceae bacterium]